VSFRLILILVVFSFLELRSQSILNQKVGSEWKGRALLELIDKLEADSKTRFFFLPAWLKTVQLEKDPAGKNLQQVLIELFENSDLTFYELHPGAVIFLRDPAKEMQHRQLVSSAIREFKKPEKIVFGSEQNFRPGQRVTLKGKVTDAKSGDPVSGATIQISDVNAGVVTDADGAFEIGIFTGNHVVRINYINYDEKVFELMAFATGELAVTLDETPMLLEEVVVTDRAAREVTTARIGQSRISVQEIRRLPALMGEVDIIRQIQAMPGVTTAGEAASGFNVRGGSVDQNLVLYEGVPVFNTSHAFGFFSAFNASSIREANFYRGGIPAEFGGRASSVLDIQAAEGDPEQWHGGGGIGILSTQIQVNGPIQKDRTTVMGTLRTTYSDLLVRSIKTNYANLSDSEVGFMDGSMKISHRFSDKARISASYYGSSDSFRITGDSSYSWNNKLFSTRFDKTFTPGFQASFFAGAGQYNYLVNNRQPETGFDLSYQITYPTAKADFSLQAGQHKFSFGGQGTWYAFDPGRLTPLKGSNAKNIVMPSKQSSEYAVYLGDGITIGEKFFAEAGIRYSLFYSLGPEKEFTYQAGQPIETVNQTGTVDYAKGEIVRSYQGLEPRVSARFSLSEKSSIKAGFNRAYQYVHLITNTTAVTPVDIWLPSGTYFRPQYADQLSAGYFRTDKDKGWEGFIEGFYKEMNGILEFKDGARLILNNSLETDLLQGVGRAYGTEVSLSKNSGRLQGTASYTWSRSLRTINGVGERDKINNGLEYPSNFDQPHSVVAQWRYGISRRIFFSGSFTFRSGRPITAPYAGYLIDQIAIGNFSERNQYRIPDYHRLDLGIVLEGSHRRNKKVSGSWSLSAVNVYGRQNPYTIFFRGQSNGIFKAYQISVIGAMIPSLTYQFKF